MLVANDKNYTAKKPQRSAKKEKKILHKQFFK